MAIAEEHLRARLGANLVDHRTYGFVSDGDLQEGVTAETASLAGHLGLGRLTYYYDDNEISIDGDTDKTFTEDVPARFRAVGWHVVDIDGHDREAIAAVTIEAQSVEDRPSLIVCHTVIARGAPTKAGTAGSHGAPLGDEEIRGAKEEMGLPTDETFHVPDGIYEWFSDAMNRGREAHAAWDRRHSDAMDDSLTASTWHAFFGTDPVSLDDPGFEVGASLATRASSGKLFGQIADKAQNFLGGSADLVESTKTLIDHDRIFSRSDRAARDLAFGIREHAMGTIVNGMAIHGGLRPYGATFFVFSDYMRPAVRLAALMGIPSIWVWTHDSVFLGEDGPTHQPIEHLASLRAMPNLDLIRPADAGEVLEAWELALNRTDGPTALVLTRQNVPTLERDRGGVAKGGSVLRDGSDVVLVATGSEVSVAVEAADLLAGRGVSARVVSLPSWLRFFEQSAEYRSEVLGESIPRVTVEAGSTFGWDRIAGTDGLTIGIDHFGASAPAGVLAEKFGLTGQAVADRVADWLP
jgi:transketolase